MAVDIISERLSKRKTRHLRERAIEFFLFSAAAFSVAVTLGIVYVLVSESYHFFEQVPLVDFLTDTQWTPLFDDAHYGIMVLLSGTLVSSGVALAVAVPLAVTVATYRWAGMTSWLVPVGVSMGMLLLFWAVAGFQLA